MAKKGRKQLDLKKKHTKKLYVQINKLNLILPFALKLHVLYAFFFNVIAVIEARSVGQIHKQTHFDLRIELNQVGKHFRF